MNSIVVSVFISAEEFQRLYQGSAKSVYAQSHDGRRISFPAAILRPYVLHTGVRGTFKIHFDEHNRFHSIERLG